MNTMQDYSYIEKYYGVPAKYGRVISYKGRRGLIVEPRGQYIGVTFNDESPTNIHSLHPTYEVEYHNETGIPRKMTRSQRRYQEYLRADSGLDFPEWLGINH